jgi:hypothetical protein
MSSRELVAGEGILLAGGYDSVGAGRAASTGNHTAISSDPSSRISLLYLVVCHFLLSSNLNNLSIYLNYQKSTNLTICQNKTRNSREC